MSDPLARARLTELLRAARLQKASDIHLEAGQAPTFRVDGRLERLSMPPLDAQSIEAVTQELIGCTEPQTDVTVMWREETTVRAHVFGGISGPAVALRLLPPHVPQFDDLDVPASIGALAERTSGLVLVTGPTGSGKSTLLAAMIDRINRTQSRHIITLEDPIEYRHTSRKSLVRQREIGKDVPSYAAGVYSALRADPDVLLIGELRSPETMRAALWASETGHLVFATLHTRDGAQAVERIVGSFEGAMQAQIRASLSQSLAGVVAVRLVALKHGGRRVCTEVLIASDAVRNLIRESRTHLIRNAIVTSRHAGMQTLELHLNALLADGRITEAEAATAAVFPDELRAEALA